jgi:hypothetical protein
MTAIRGKTKGPPAARDPLAEARQRELRERLAQLPEERRKQIITEGVAHDDEFALKTNLKMDNSPGHRAS